VKRALALATLALAACGKLQGTGGIVPPLVTFNVSFTDPTMVLPQGIAGTPSLQVGLVWGAQWLTEPFCVLRPESDAAKAVIDAGCRDTFGFVPARVDVSAPVAADGTAALPLFQLPTADVLIGDVTARVAYREGAFNTNGAFYPRAGCGDPPAGFSILAASGFSKEKAIAATLAGTLPQEDDPAMCSEMPSATVVPIAAQAPTVVDEVGCDERTDDGSSRYREPPVDAPDLTDRVSACAHLSTFETGGLAGFDGGVADGGAADGGAGLETSIVQFVVSGRSTDRCKGLTHYTLRGCRESVTCALPDWDFTAKPPSWWTCPR
jgi:hypothetical protein